MADVIVIGGGPAGSYTALTLAKAGVSTLVLEAKKEIGLKVNCTGIVSLECANRFQNREQTATRGLSSCHYQPAH